MWSRRQLISACLGMSPMMQWLMACDSTGAQGRSAPMKPRATVLVIGAGMAGLAAAKTLQSKGYRVTVLEARSRYGGRIFTTTSMGTPIDMGAAWIHGAFGNPMSNLARRHKIKVAPCSYDNMIVYDVGARPLSAPKLKQLNAGYKDVKVLIESGEGSLRTPVAEAVRHGLAGESMTAWERRALDWILSVQQVTAGVDMESLSMRYAADDSGYMGGDRLFPGGYHQLCQVMARGLDLRLNHVVDRVAYDDKGVHVRTSRGEFYADGVVVTLPLGVLQSNRVAFQPRLPMSKRQAIKHLKMGILDKVALRFKAPFWPKTPHFLGYLRGSKGAFPAFLNMRMFANDAPVLVGFLGGEYARELEQHDDRAMVHAAMATLRAMFGNRIPSPVSSAVVRWGQDPFAFGSYSHVPVGSNSSYYDVMASPVGGRVFFAGEATSRRWRGTVHGAWRSGVDVVAIMDRLS